LNSKNYNSLKSIRMDKLLLLRAEVRYLEAGRFDGGDGRYIVDSFLVGGVGEVIACS